jgi:adenylylsulfate kinase
MINNIAIHKRTVTRSQKEIMSHQKGCVVWLTGLPGSGKSTIANALELKLFKKGYSTIILDGDNIRHGLNSDLGFSKKDREENIRRIGEAAKLIAENGQVVIAAFVSPYRKDRDKVRAKISKRAFIEVFVKCSPAECRKRDPKGLYKKAHSGELKGFTGVSAPYEPPEQPEITIDTEAVNIHDSADMIFRYLSKKGYLD